MTDEAEIAQQRNPAIAGRASPSRSAQRFALHAGSPREASRIAGAWQALLAIVTTWRPSRKRIMRMSLTSFRPRALPPTA